MKNYTFTFKDQQGYSRYVFLTPDGSGGYTAETLRQTYTIKRAKTKKDGWYFDPPIAPLERAPTLESAAAACFNHAEKRIRITLPYGTVCRVSYQDSYLNENPRTLGIFTDEIAAKAWVSENPEYRVGVRFDLSPLLLKDVRVYYTIHVLNSVGDKSSWVS